MKVFVLFALAALCVATPLEQVKADLARLEADIRAKTNPAFLAQTPNDDDASLSASEEERIRRVVEAEPDLVQFGDDPKFEEHDESAGESFDDDASLTPNSMADPNCSAARGVCMDNAATNCRAPRQVRRGLCNGANHRMCCVGSNEGGSPAAPETRPVATNTNWLTEVGGVKVTRMDRSGRSSFPTHVPNKFVVHTTEGWWPRPGVEGSHAALDGARVWAHFLIGVGRDGSLKVYQYLPLNVRATALKRNNLGSIQVEVSALTCCPFTSYDKALTDLTRALFTAVRAACPNIKNEVIAPNDWARPVRFSVDNWNRASGITGHMFAPVPDDHNDPGHINPSALLSDFSASTLTFKSTNELRQCLTQCRVLPHIVRYYSDPNREVSFTKF